MSLSLPSVSERAEPPASVRRSLVGGVLAVDVDRLGFVSEPH